MNRRQRRAHAWTWAIHAVVLALVICTAVILRAHVAHEAERARLQGAK